MAASLYDFNIEKGSSFTLSIIYKEDTGTIIDLTGYCARLIWRTNLGETQEFLTTDTNYNEYKFIIDGIDGRISLKLPASTTNNYEFKSAKYDLEIQSPIDHYTQGGKFTTRILYGTVTIISRNSQSNNLLDCIV
jgi:hypothetical protein